MSRTWLPLHVGTPAVRRGSVGAAGLRGKLTSTAGPWEGGARTLPIWTYSLKAWGAQGPSEGVCIGSIGLPSEYHKLGGLEEISCLAVVEAGHLKSRCQQGCAPSAGSRGGSFCTPSSFWWPRMFLDCGSTTPPSSSVVMWCHLSLHIIFPLFLCPNSPFL